MLQNFWIGTDFTGLFSALPAPNDTVKALLDSQVKNIRALEEANQHAIEAFHAVFNRQNQALHASLEEVAKAMMAVPTTDAQTNLARQSELAKTATEHTLANLREISETIASASEKAAQVLNKRIQENLNEIHALTQGK